MSEEALRAELASAIDALVRHERCVSVAAEALAAGESCLAAAEADLTGFADLAQRETEWTVAQVRRGHRDDPPPEMMERRVERVRAGDEVERCSRAVTMLSDEVWCARQDRDAATDARDRAAVAIISRHADDLADRVEEALARVFEARGELLSMTGAFLPLGGHVTALPVSDKVRVSLRRAADRPPVDEAVKRRTAAWFERLKSDPSAEP